MLINTRHTSLIDYGQGRINLRGIAGEAALVVANQHVEFAITGQVAYGYGATQTAIVGKIRDGVIVLIVGRVNIGIVAVHHRIDRSGISALEAGELVDI